MVPVPLSKSRLSLNCIQHFSILVLPILFTSFANISNGATLSPADQIRLDSAISECSEPGKECPKLLQSSIQTIEYLRVGDEDLWSNPDEPGALSEDGLLVTYIQDSKVETSPPLIATRFFPLSKVELSPDDQYYMCPRGREFKIVPDMRLESLGIDPIDLSNVLSEGFQPTSFICKCFWAPKSLFDTLDIDKKKISRPQVPLDTGPFDFPDATIFPPKTVGTKPYGIIIERPISIFDRPRFNSWHSNDPSPSSPPPPPLAPIPIGGKCGLFPWKCALDAVFDFMQGPRE